MPLLDIFFVHDDTTDSMIENINSICSNLDIEVVNAVIRGIWIIAQSFSYLFMLCYYFTRLLIIFDNSSYQIAPFHKKVLIAGCCICVLLAVVLVLVYNVSAGIIAHALALLCVVLYMCLALYFGFVLARQFRMIINNLRRCQRQNKSNKNDNEDLSDLRILLPIWETMTRFTLLLFTSLVLTITIFTIAILILNIPQIVYANKYGRGIASILIIIENLNNIICIALQFNFTDKYYRKLCGKCGLCLKERYITGATGVKMAAIELKDNNSAQNIYNNNNNNNDNVNKKEMKANTIKLEQRTNINIKLIGPNSATTTTTGTINSNNHGIVKRIRSESNSEQNSGMKKNLDIRLPTTAAGDMTPASELETAPEAKNSVIRPVTPLSDVTDINEKNGTDTSNEEHSKEEASK